MQKIQKKILAIPTSGECSIYQNMMKIQIFIQYAEREYENLENIHTTPDACKLLNTYFSLD